MVTVNLVTASGKTTIAEQGMKGFEVSGARTHQELSVVSSAVLTFPATNTHVRSAIGTCRPVIEVLDDDQRVFYGAVVTTKKDALGAVEFNCDGAMSFLSDIVKAPFACTDKTPPAYIETIISQYNAAVSDERKVWFGGVTGFDSEGNVNIHHSDEYVDTLSLFREVVEKYGGYIVETFGGGTVKPYVGWMYEIDTDSGKIIEFGKNGVSLSDQLDFSNYASRVYATSSDGTHISGDYVIDQNSENAYGRRDYGHHSNGSIVLAATEALVELFKRKDPIQTVELSALDLQKLGVDHSGFAIGTTARLVESNLIDVNMRVNSIDRDLMNKLNSRIVLGRESARLTSMI